MPARLLVVADPKMLPALASGLREGGRFEVAPLPWAELSSAPAACASADAVALFYGAPDKPLAAALQLLSPPLRERGARVVAVLQKDQAAQRDDCFRAGASDVLFMPMPKDQFVGRLVDSVALAFAGEGGLGAQVSLATRSATHKLEAAAVLAGGVVAPVGPELKSGDTVRLAWAGVGASFQAWGLVARSDAQGVRIRLAGMAPEEEARLREWLKGAPVASQPPPAPSWSSAPTVAETPKVYPPTVADAPAAAPGPYPPRVADAPAIGPVAPTPPALAAAPAPSKAPDTVVSAPAFPEQPASASTSSPSVRGVPTAGPPPGFAGRPPIRPQSGRGVSKPGATSPLAPDGRPGAPAAPPGPPGTQTPPGQSPISAPGITPAFGSAAAPAPAPAAAQPAAPAPAAAAPAPAAEAAAQPAPAPPAAAAPAPAAPAGPPPAGPPPAPGAPAVPAPEGLAASLFDEAPVPGPGAAPGAPAAAAAPPAGPPWPVAVDLDVCKSWLAVMLKERNLPASAGPEWSAAMVKVAGGLSSGERETLEKVGTESHFHEALVARAALALCGAAGSKLFGVQPPAVVDQAQVTALTQLADAAGKRLQAEADRAIAKGEVETLQMVTAASAALSREQLSFKEIVDRLRGLAAAPRLGAGALDPDMQVPGQAPRAAARPQPEKEAQKRLELKDFAGLQPESVTKSRKRLLVIGGLVFAVSLANALWWSHPGARPASAQLVERAGVGVINISIADAVAMVRVSKGWYQSQARKENLSRLCEALASRGVKKAVLALDGDSTIGHLEVPLCRAIGLAPPPKPADAQQPAPPAPK